MEYITFSFSIFTLNKNKKRNTTSLNLEGNKKNVKTCYQIIFDWLAIYHHTQLIYVSTLLILSICFFSYSLNAKPKQKIKLQNSRAAKYIKQLELRSELEDTGYAIYTIRILPKCSMKVKSIQITCIYHQEFMWENSQGIKRKKIHEPFAFTYKAFNIEFIDDLNCYINFPLPLSHKRLAFIYGKMAFHPDYPVQVSKVIITAYTQSPEKETSQLFTMTISKEAVYILESENSVGKK